MILRAGLHRAIAIAIAVVSLTGCGAEGITGETTSAPGIRRFSGWEAPINAEELTGASTDLNSPFLDGCPIQSPDGRKLYMASMRPGGLGGIDIWVADRIEPDGSWGAPENLGAPVNSRADDFCPTPVRDGLYFVSARPGGCGGPDVYFARAGSGARWQTPENLGCTSEGGPNGPMGEASPSLVSEEGRSVLYFSSNRPGGFAEDGKTPDSDIYASALGTDGRFTQARLVAGLNTAGDDSRPNVRRDALEIVFDRAAAIGGPADLYVATRRSTSDAWSAPSGLGARVNTPANESRASLSFDGRTLLFGSNRPGSEPDAATGEPSNDIYVTTRDGSLGRE